MCATSGADDSSGGVELIDKLLRHWSNKRTTERFRRQHHTRSWEHSRMNPLKRDKDETAKSRKFNMVCIRINWLMVIPALMGMMSGTNNGFWLAAVMITAITVAHIFSQCLQMSRLRHARRSLYATAAGPAAEEAMPRFKCWYGCPQAILETVVLIAIMVVMALRVSPGVLMGFAMITGMTQGGITIIQTRLCNNKNFELCEQAARGELKVEDKSS